MTLDYEGYGSMHQDYDLCLRRRLMQADVHKLEFTSDWPRRLNRLKEEAWEMANLLRKRKL